MATSPATAPEIAPTDLYVPDTALIAKHIKRADYIVITHGHSDHALDAGMKRIASTYDTSVTRGSRSQESVDKAKASIASSNCCR